MPFTHSFQREFSDFVLLRAIGAIDLVMWANAMRNVIADRTFRAPMPVLLDLTEALGPLRVQDMAVMARTWCLMTPYSFGAIVAPDDVTLGLARRIEELSEERVRAFADLPTAVQWLQDQLRAPDRSYC
jgi:hypothetical protein